MPKCTIEQCNIRRNEIIDACEKLYETMGFKDVTIKAIGTETSFTRTSIYNYFQTKEEIFLGSLQREYERWNDDLRKKEITSKEELAVLLAETLSKRQLMLKILAMNMYDIEENSRLERLVDFKKVICETFDIVGELYRKIKPPLTEAQFAAFQYSFFPFVYGIYPYTHATEKQAKAMSMAGIDYKQQSIYDLALTGARKLLEV